MSLITAKDMWDKLHKSFEEESLDSIDLLKKKCYRYTKDPSDDIMVHKSKVK